MPSQVAPVVITVAACLVVVAGIAFSAYGVTFLKRAYPFRIRDVFRTDAMRPEDRHDPRPALLVIGLGLANAFGVATCAYDSVGELNARNGYIATFTPLSEGYFRLLERAAPAGGTGRVGRVVLLDVTSRRLAELGIERFVAETEGGGMMRPQRIPAADHVMAMSPASIATLAFVKCAESVLFAYRTVELISRPGGVGVRVDCGLTLNDARTGALVSSRQFRGGDPPTSAPHLSDKHYGERPDKDVIEFIERAMAR